MDDTAVKGGSLFHPSPKILVEEARADDLVLEDPIDRQHLLGDIVGYGRKWLGQSHRVHGKSVEDLGARGAPQLEVGEAAVLGDVELEHQLALDTPVTRLTGRSEEHT